MGDAGDTEREQNMGRSRGANTERFHVYIGIAAALWVIAAVAAVIDRDTLMAISWSCMAAFGILVAIGAAHRSRGIGYLSVALVVAGVAISMAVFLSD